MSILNQVIATAILSYICTTMGILYTLPASTLKLFSSENTTLNRIMTETELSFMGSISSASTVLVTPFCGFFLDTFGRKWTVILFYVTQILGWLLLVTAYRVEAFIISMFLCGLSGNIFLIVPVYVNKFCEPTIRGALSSSPVIFNGIGMLVSYVLGGVLDYKTMNYTGFTLAVIGIVMAFILKESPLYLMKKGLEEVRSRTLYRILGEGEGVKSNSKGVIEHMNNIKRLLKSDIEQRRTLEETEIKPEEEKPEEKKPIQKLEICKYLAKSRSSRRALLFLIILNTLCTFQGIVVIQIYAGLLFEAAVPSMSGTASSVIFGIISVGTGIVTACLLDKLGRRILLIVAATATGIFCLILGTHIQFSLGPSWLSPVFIYLYVVSFTMGPGTVPVVLLGEVFLPKIKSFAITLVVQWIYTCNFIILYVSIPIINIYGLGPMCYTFASFSFITAIFSFIYLPETKCLPVDIIQRKILEK